MTLALPKYTSKDYVVLAMILLPFTLICNSIIFEGKYFSSIGIFFLSTLITAVAFSLYFTLCGGVAVLLKNHYPNEEQVPRRLTCMIITFLLMSGLFLLLLFNLYQRIAFFNYRIDEDSFIWAYFALGIGNVFITFLHEGIDRYESWKISQQEMEHLKKTYRQGRLQGLKSQVNPHFLFNSLNSLSSLITEDGERAEKFLDEMSKVYRYMLRNDDDQLVTLDSELKFVDSYSYLLKTRYCEGLDMRLDIDAEDRKKLLPPLALQTIIENAITQNAISKCNPLHIGISAKRTGLLEVTNNLQPKQITDSLDAETGLDNLVHQYELLDNEKVVINESADQRTILLPLVTKKKGGTNEVL